MGGQGRQRFFLGLAGLSAVLALAYALGLIVDWPPWLHGVNWVWLRRTPEPGAARFAFLVLLFLLWLVVLWLILKPDTHAPAKPWSKQQTILLLVGMISLTCLMQLGIASQHRSQPLAVAFLTAVGYFQPGVEIDDPLLFIQQHAAQMPHYRNVHLKTQPPAFGQRVNCGNGCQPQQKGSAAGSCVTTASQLICAVWLQPRSRLRRCK
jgi:hypothetical protein